MRRFFPPLDRRSRIELHAAPTHLEQPPLPPAAGKDRHPHFARADVHVTTLDVEIPVVHENGSFCS